MKLSIITINRNNAAGLEKTLKSVAEQTFTDFEYIVIDGASTDESVDIIKKYADKITYWVSEPDTGIYNAMNKGIRKAHGDYCLFLNSGDWLIDSSKIENVFSEIDSITGADIYYSDRLDNDGRITIYPADLNTNLQFLIYNPISHQNSLIKRTLFLEHEFYNEQLKISSDWEYFLKEIWIHKSRFVHISTKIAIFDISGIGSQDSEERRSETVSVYKNVFQELSGIILEFKHYDKSVYGNIVNTLGYTKTLNFILRIYRFFAKRIRIIK